MGHLLGHHQDRFHHQLFAKLYKGVTELESTYFQYYYIANIISKKIRFQMRISQILVWKRMVVARHIGIVTQKL